MASDAHRVKSLIGCAPMAGAEQHACHEALCAAGACVAVAYDIDNAIERLEQWQLLRPNTSTQIGRAFAQLRRDIAARRTGRNPSQPRTEN
jgi:hypothetical protein